MNPRIAKLRAEKSKNCDRISSLQARNKRIDERILKLENTDILGMVREIGMTPDQLAELLGRAEKVQIASEMEDGGNDGEF